jgi:hypothetical protein
LIALIFIMGLFPSPFLNLAKPSVDRWVAHLEKVDPTLAGNPPRSTGTAAARAQVAAPAGTARMAAPAPRRVDAPIRLEAQHIDPSALRRAQPAALKPQVVQPQADKQ